MPAVPAFAPGMLLDQQAVAAETYAHDR